MPLPLPVIGWTSEPLQLKNLTPVLPGWAGCGSHRIPFKSKGEATRCRVDLLRQHQAELPRPYTTRKFEGDTSHSYLKTSSTPKHLKPTDWFTPTWKNTPLNPRCSLRKATKFWQKPWFPGLTCLTGFRVEWHGGFLNLSRLFLCQNAVFCGLPIGAHRCKPRPVPQQLLPKRQTWAQIWLNWTCR